MIRRLTLALLVLAALSFLAASADANHGAPTRISAGAINGNTNGNGFGGLFDGNTPDGTRVWFHTDEKLVSGDTDAGTDLYERSGGVTTQISVGPNGYNGAFGAGWKGATADGSTVYFQTNEPLVASDTDAGCSLGEGGSGPCFDIYANNNGNVSLVSTPGNGTFHAAYRGASADGSRVFFRTEEQMSAADTDNEGDIYQRSGGTTTLVSTGPAGGNGPHEARWRGLSTDGTRVFFDTTESLVAADTDSTGDTYERSGGTTTLLSTGPAGGNGNFDAAFRGMSKDGSHVFFETAEPLVAADTDTAIDVYERSGGTTTLVSAGTNGSGDSLYEGSSDGGTRVFFTTTDQLSGADTDNRRDVYERSGGTSTLLSTGPAGGNGPNDAEFEAASADGSVAVIGTAESLVAADTDGRFDLYTRSAGTTSLASQGSGSFNGAFDASYRDISADGSRVIFETPEQLEASDTDVFPDLYERYGGVTYRIASGGSTNGNAAGLSVFDGASDDATRIFFQTGEQLDATDTDTQTDIYQAAVKIAYARPKGATPTLLPLVPAYQACASPNRMHFPGLSFPSCAPPVQTTTRLQVGTADSNSQATRSTSTARFVSMLGDSNTQADEADVAIYATVNDVYQRAGGNDPPDYTGEVGLRVPLQITDKSNGSVPQDAGTVTDYTLVVPIGCVATGSPPPSNIAGADCIIATTADAITPGIVKEDQRTIWQMGSVTVSDGGADDLAGTDPNATFLREGIFVP